MMSSTNRAHVHTRIRRLAAAEAVDELVTRQMNVTTTSDSNPEADSLDLLADLQKALATALNSLAGRIPATICDGYYVDAGSYINKAIEGYVLLRMAGRIDASKLLIRPAMEAIIRVGALRRQPELLYQIGYTESLEDRKWFRPAAAAVGAEYDDKADPPGWAEFEAAFKEAFPDAQPKREKLTLETAAEIAGLKRWYDMHYRMYCKYAHAALRATGGHMDQMSDSADTRTMVWCAFLSLEAIAAIGGDAPQLQELYTRVDSLTSQPPLTFGREVVR